VVPADASLLWMPLAWTVQIEGAAVTGVGTKLESLSLRNLGVVLRNLRTKQTAFRRMTRVGTDESRIALEGGTVRATFSLPLFSRLEEGEYAVEALQATYVDPSSGRTEDLSFPLDNPFQTPSGKPPLPLQARKGNIAALPRLAALTSFAVKGGGLVSLTEVENVDKEVVPVDLVLTSGRLNPADAPLVYAASPDFPRARVPLLSPAGEPQPPEPAVARVGLLIDVPCKTSGFVDLVWKRISDDREYASAIPLTSAGSACENTRTLNPILALPGGDWLLRSTHIVTLPAAKPVYRLATLKAPEPDVARALMLSQRAEAYAAVGLEKELKRQMIVRLTSAKPGGAGGMDASGRPRFYVPQGTPRTDAVLFLGRFELVPVDDRKAEAWDTVFKRTFSLEALRSAFRVTDVYNAYTLARIGKSREKGTVQGVLRVSSSQSDARKLESSTSEFRKSATEIVAACVTEREEVDPLVTVEGQGIFHGLKGANGVTIKQMTTSDESGSSEWVRECVQKKLTDLRFSRKLPASFQAEYKFLAE